MNANNIDTVINFAAQSHVCNSYSNPIQYTKDNVLGTHTLLDCCFKYNLKTDNIKKFIHISTDEVYGESDLGEEKKMEQSVLEVPLKVNATLSQPIVNLSKLLRLNVGNTIEIPISDKIDVYVEDIKMFNGDLGEYKGSAAVNIKKRI